jgi:hypothetical protein
MPQVGTSSTWKDLHAQLRPSLAIVRPMTSQCSASDTLPTGATCCSAPIPAAAHTMAATLKWVLGVSQGVDGLPASGPEMQLQAYTMRAWAAFANDKEIGRPTYNSAEATLVRPRFNNNPCADFALPSTYNSPCSSLNPSFYRT